MQRLAAVRSLDGDRREGNAGHPSFGAEVRGRVEHRGPVRDPAGIDVNGFIPRGLRQTGAGGTRSPGPGRLERRAGLPARIALESIDAGSCLERAREAGTEPGSTAGGAVRRPPGERFRERWSLGEDDLVESQAVVASGRPETGPEAEVASKSELEVQGPAGRARDVREETRNPLLKGLVVLHGSPCLRGGSATRGLWCAHSRVESSVRGGPGRGYGASRPRAGPCSPSTGGPGARETSSPL